MLEIIRGEIPNRLLFVPRLDIWYHQNKARGTLPRGYENLSLMDVSSKLGVVFHSVVPDFIRSAPVEDLYHRGLGFYNNPDFPYMVDFGDLEYDVHISEDEMITIYYTTKGEIKTRCNYGAKFFKTGSSIPNIIEPAV